MGQPGRTMRIKTIAVMATLDTKGVEAQYVAEQIRRLGHDPLLIDTGVVGFPAATAAITREEVAQAGGMPLWSSGWWQKAKFTV